jgi:glyoxylase-like metal-dependent hydrolase (beta-lactamase superfamily II)
MNEFEPSAALLVVAGRSPEHFNDCRQARQPTGGACARRRFVLGFGIGTLESGGGSNMHFNSATVISLGCFAYLVAAGAWGQPREWYQQTAYQGRQIGRLTGDVYYARQDDYVSAFMVTSGGIVLVEPIGTEMAMWLKDELDERFDVPVRYVIYSHVDWDHASGAAVWDTAHTIGQENLLTRLAMPPPDTPLPDNLQMEDSNEDGMLSRREAQGNFRERFVLYDENEDGQLSGAEVRRGPLAYVRPPDLTYREYMTIELGGKRVELISIPTAHAADNTVVRFVDGTNVLFASDWITINRTPFGADVATRDEISKVRTVAAMDFEYFLCSHGRVGTKADVLANLQYREAVRDRVALAIARGQTLDEVRESVLMEEYEDWEFYSVMRAANIAGAYRALMENR